MFILSIPILNNIFEHFELITENVKFNFFLFFFSMNIKKLYLLGQKLKKLENAIQDSLYIFTIAVEKY